MSPAAKRSGNPAVRAAAGAVSVDLDARRQAVREARGGAVIIRLGGRDLRATDEMPIEFGIALSELDLARAARLIFPDEGDAEAFLAACPTMEDLTAIAEDGWGVDLGEASASSGYSLNTGSPLKPISNASTG